MNEPPGVHIAAATQALAKWAEREEQPGLLGYQFFANPSEKMAGAVVIYANAEAWLGHHDMFDDLTEDGAGFNNPKPMMNNIVHLI